MTITDEQRTKLRQTLSQMKHELVAIQQQLESAKEKYASSSYNYSQPNLEGWTLDEYILGFRLGNITDLSMHLHEVFQLSKKSGAAQ